MGRQQKQRKTRRLRRPYEGRVRRPPVQARNDDDEEDGEGDEDDDDDEHADVEIQVRDAPDDADRGEDAQQSAAARAKHFVTFKSNAAAAAASPCMLHDRHAFIIHSSACSG